MELERAMQDSDFISFAMELMAHDLFWLMCHDPCMCRKNARRWSAQIALGIDSLHQMGIIHRDLKAENVLIDVRGNIRIVDFGLAHLGAGPLHWWGEYTDEVMGTLQCMAPEMLQNKDVHTRFKRYYGISVDWWALGCLIYELESEDHLALFSGEESTIGYVNWVQNIRPRNPRHRFPAFIGLSDEAESVISGLLRIRYSFRYKLSDLLQHPYFAIGENATEFDDAEARALARPVDPSLELDFLPDDGDGTLRLFSPDAVVSSWGPHHPDFSEFTWINPRSGVKK
ncbi:kinase-like protein [Leucogyrophana mollusca]|uniref:Kinase-like protein n=1 Tax=Leucogyrophana mollusca TaxID=85980 RepID=A0ACB8BUD7_9AGAM|nr:kinase-like protein [Leucogyrophana mollusca]